VEKEGISVDEADSRVRRGHSGRTLLRGLLRFAPVALVFGKYERIRRLAQGGMGDVFLARQTGVLDRLAILKALKHELVAEQEFVEQFLDEARVAATLNHPNIVAIYDVGEWNGTYYIAMEYIAGEDLAKIWYAAAKAGVGLPFQVTVRIIMDAALGLDHAHRARDVRGRPMNIVHRDISPQNIMVRADGVTKLVDFGIAKAANKSSKTQAGMVKGKLQYMSPEQVRGEALDGRSDQFSLGVVIWEMCTGRRLFKADSEINTLQKILQAPIPKPSQFVSGFPGELEAVIMRMLERDANKRFAALGEVALKLKEFLDRSSVQAGEVSVSAFMHQILGRELEERTRDLTPMENSTSGPAVKAPPPSPRPAPVSLTAPATVPMAPQLSPRPSPPSPSPPPGSAVAGAVSPRKDAAARRPAPPPEPGLPEDPDDRDAPTQVVPVEERPDRRPKEGGPRAGPQASRKNITPQSGGAGATQHARAEPSERPPPPAAAPQEWLVRRRDGTMARAPNTAIVEQWIKEGRLLATDLVSADGRRFTPLGSDPNFVACFASSDASASSASSSAPTLSSTARSGGARSSGDGSPRLPGAHDTDAPGTKDTTLPGEEPVTDGENAVGPSSVGGDAPFAAGAKGDAALDPFAQAPTSAFSLGALPQHAMTGQWQIGDQERQALAAASPVAPRPSTLSSSLRFLRSRPGLLATAITFVLLMALVVAALRSCATSPDPSSIPLPPPAEGSTGTPGATPLGGQPAAIPLAPPPSPPEKSPPSPTPTSEVPSTAPTSPPAAAAPETPSSTPPTPTASTTPAPAAPETYETLVPRAQKALKAGRAVEAARLFKTALDKKPGDNVAQLGLSWAQLRFGKHEAAAQGFRAVLARDAGASEAQYGLGEALRAAGRTVDAVAAYQKYLDTTPQGPFADAAKNAINALQ
jgi:serine/threonine protein kinase